MLCVLTVIKEYIKDFEILMAGTANTTGGGGSRFNLNFDTYLPG